MKPKEWVGSRHGRMVARALDTQVLPIMAKYRNLGATIPTMLAATRLVMEEQLHQHGRPENISRSLVLARQLINDDGVLCGYARELEAVVHRLCITWLVGDVETVDRSTVKWGHLSAAYRCWREKTCSVLLSNGPEHLRRILRWRRAGTPR